MHIPDMDFLHQRINSPPWPSTDQIAGTFATALTSGVIATSLFYWARNATHSAWQIAAVDATLAGEVLITLLFEIYYLHQDTPGPLSIIGLLAITFGLVGYCFKDLNITSLINSPEKGEQ